MGLQLLYPKSKVLICFQHFIIIKPDFWKRQQKLSPKLPILKKKNWAKSVAIAFFLLVLSSSLLSLFLLSQCDFWACWAQKTCLLALFHSNGCKFRLRFVFKKTARYISLHKKADFLTACSAAWDLCLTVIKFCMGKIHAKILAKTERACWKSMFF